MESINNFLLAAITILVGAVGYLLKKTFDKVERIDEAVSDMRPKVDLLWGEYGAVMRSPRQLNERGYKIMNESHIDKVIDEMYQELASEVKKQTYTNPLDADEAVIKVVKTIPERRPELIDKLKTGAFNSGVTMGEVLFVGSIYMRDKIFPELGFPLDSKIQPE